MDYDRLGIARVINAAGRLTTLGGVALAPEVLEAMNKGGQYMVDMEELKDRAGALIAKYAGAPGGMVTTGAAAGICIMAAAVVAGSDPGRVRALPDATWPKRCILLQAGHAISFGAPVTQMLRIGGAAPVAVGDVNKVTEPMLEAAFSPDVAGFLFVQSHHAVQKGMLSLQKCISICKKHGVPVLVDAAAEEDIQQYVALGADLVAYSGGKAFGGPTSGFVVGEAGLIKACRAQESGIARPMKVGKETVMGLLAALEQYCTGDRETEHKRQLGLIQQLSDRLAGLPHSRLHLMNDEAGRDIVRLGLTLDEARLGFTAVQLLEALQRGSPSVVLRGHWANTGTVAIDPRPIESADVPVIAERILCVYAERGHPVTARP